MMQRLFFNSSNLDSGLYDPKTKTLSIVFTNGRKYIYEDVPEETVKGLRTAPSQGRYFNENIKDNFEFSEV